MVDAQGKVGALAKAEDDDGGERPSWQLPEHSKVESVYLIVRRDILEGNVPPAHNFQISELCTRFGINAATARSALEWLEGEDYVSSVTPVTGFKLQDITADRIRHVYMVREDLEGRAACIAADVAGDQDLNALKRIHTEVAKALDPSAPDPETFITVGRDFHMRLMAAAKNETLRTAWEATFSPAVHRRVARSLSLRDMLCLHRDHERIVWHLAMRDGEGARMRLIESLRYARNIGIASVGDGRVIRPDDWWRDDKALADVHLDFGYGAPDPFSTAASVRVRKRAGRRWGTYV